MNWKQIKQTIGPGILYAGAAIGVSHLVNSTKAGALFGYQLLWVVVFSNLIKFPFFEFATRYTSYTKINLVQAYKNLHHIAFVLLVLLTLSTMFIIQSGVTIVTAGILEKILNLSNSPLTFWQFSFFVLVVAAAILIAGKYSRLDKFMKIVIFVLAFCTIFSLCASFQVEIPKVDRFKTAFSFFQKEHLLFVVVLAGWMPAPLDIAIWNSIWTSEKQALLPKNSGITPQNSLKSFLVDFHIGYWLTAVMAIVFLALGAQIIFGTGEELSTKGSVFTGQLIKIYTKSIGEWSYWIIISTAFATMFSTTITCLDAYSRMTREFVTVAFPRLLPHKKTIYNIGAILLVLLCTLMLANFIQDMGQMIKIATVISFIVAPIIAIINTILINSKLTPKEIQPKKLFNTYSIFCIICLCSFSLLYLWILSK